ncbi:site-specific integrase [Paenibacillus sp. FSL H8-0034]|uniref:site-specific integrase n=1 Tax=Paenibacillus sp. FSL H8-0034 TaxID=2954671 RepID=UPI0030FC19CF
MKFVQPIRDPQKLEAIKEHLKDTNERDYILFLIGINTGLRISDILPLQVKNVKGTHIDIVEKKTQKRQLIMMNDTLRNELTAYVTGKPDDEYLFPSRSIKTKTRIKSSPIDRSMAYKILSGAARKFGLNEIGCHTLRKTFGYHFYLKTKDIALLMDLFNHSEQSITLRYIGIKQDTLDSALSKFSL